MKAVETENTNSKLLGDGGSVGDLPIARIQFTDGMVGVESCWELSETEKEEVIRTGRVYFLCMGVTHPPICLSPYSALSGKVEGQEENKNENN